MRTQHFSRSTALWLPCKHALSYSQDQAKRRLLNQMDPKLPCDNAETQNQMERSTVRFPAVKFSSLLDGKNQLLVCSDTLVIFIFFFCKKKRSFSTETECINAGHLFLFFWGLFNRHFNKDAALEVNVSTAPERRLCDKIVLPFTHKRTPPFILRQSSPPVAARKGLQTVTVSTSFGSTWIYFVG